MTEMSTISADKIVAYVDGELDADARAEVETAAAADPAVAAGIAAHRSLRAQLAAAFGPVADEPVPDRLLRATAPAEAEAEAKVIAFKPRAVLGRPLVMQFAAMAAQIEQAGKFVADIVQPLAQGGDGLALEEVVRRPSGRGARPPPAQQGAVENGNGGCLFGHGRP